MSHYFGDSSGCNSKPNKQEFKILIYPDKHTKKKFYAHCLDLDFIVEAGSPDDALERIIYIIESYFSRDSHFNWNDEFSEPADIEFWCKIPHATKKEVDNHKRKNKYEAFEYSS